MKQKIATIVGGSGFVGRHVVKLLANEGYTVNVLCRDVIAAAALKTAGNPGQIVLQHADITNPASLLGKCAGSSVVINLVSTLVSRGKQRFDALNIDGARAIAKEAKTAGATTLIHISALGVDRATDTQYGKTKLAGEVAVREEFSDAIILRPSLVFGSGDGFFERFAKMSNLAPALPLIGGGKNLFQPVYVGDVAAAIVAAISVSEARNKTFGLAGPSRYSFKELLQLLLSTTGRKRCLVKLPFAVANVMGTVSDILPFPPQITRDQVRQLHHDNVMVDEIDGLKVFGIAPTALETILPDMLKRYSQA